MDRSEEANWLINLGKTLKSTLLETGAIRKSQLSHQLQALPTYPENDGCYVEVATIMDGRIGIYLFLDNSLGFHRRALYYGVGAGDKRDIRAFDVAAGARWPYARRLRSDPAKEIRSFDEPVFENFYEGEFYAGWYEREEPPVE
ncbi:MAG: hypothetical protein M3Z17_09835, partial [Gemmatimonadota bacterium]|nr:hypothetical protein [Gemmatimonadota bacterium]